MLLNISHCCKAHAGCSIFSTGQYNFYRTSTIWASIGVTHSCHSYALLMYVVIVLQHSLIWSNFQAFRSSKNWTMEGLEHTHTAHGWIKLINLATPHLTCIYCIAGNFQGRKLSQIGKNYDFHKENFRGLLACAAPKDATPPNFAEKTCANSHKPWNSWRFSPSKVSRYTVCMVL